MEPLGIDTLSSMSGIDRVTIESIIEPWLLQNNKIMKTPKGRVVIWIFLLFQNVEITYGCVY